MLLANRLNPCKLLKQSNPMIMIKSIDNITNNEIYCKIKICDIWKKYSKNINVWIIIESMGQAAEILIRSKGIKGEGYLVKIDDFNFKEYIKELKYEEIIIKSKIESNFKNYFLSYVELNYKNRVVVTGRVTHCFK